MQYAPASLTDVCNIALQECGVQPINDMDDLTSPAAGYCRDAFWPAVREVARAHDWNCLKKRARLALLGPAVTGVTPATPPAYWTPNTLYTATGAGLYVTYATATYLCLVTHTSSSNFINDLTAGLWSQSFMPNTFSTAFGPNVQGNAGTDYEWNYAYGLPEDYILLVELNGNNVTWNRGVGSLYELYAMQTINADQSKSNTMALFCNTSTAVIKYVALIQDPTIWDSLFTGCVGTLLGSKIATQLNSDGGKLSMELLQKYRSATLPAARVQDGGERKERRYNPIQESRFIKSRNFGTNS